MGGGVIQLITYGKQDVYLTGNPQITYFKTVYRRHTNFATECIQQRIEGNINRGSKVKCKIARDGDLISNIYFEFESQATDYPINLGNYMFEKVDLLIGDQLISSLTGHYMYIHSLLTQDFTKKIKYTLMINQNDNKIGKLMIPLPFWFCNNSSQAIPLIALQYSEVVLNIEFKNFINNTYQGIFNDSTGEVWVEYIFLDTNERRRFAQVSHEYLIEQVQFEKKKISERTVIDLNFNNPIKELIFSTDFNEDGVINKLVDTDDTADTEIPTISMTLNGNDIFQKNRNLYYFTRTQIYEKHSGEIEDRIGVFSFALRPEEHQPSGTLNFSTLKNFQIIFNDIKNTNNDIMIVYGINYNFLRIISGVAGLAYSS
jgi:hypothetical protein